MNKVLLVGRLARNPETNVTPSGIKYSRFTIAVDRNVNDAQADFVPVIAWRAQADFVDSYIRKGFLVAVEGRFSSSTFTNTDNQRITRYEVTAERVNGLETKAQVSARENTSGITASTTKMSESLQFEEESSALRANNEDKNADDNENNVPWDIDL